jgi:uncharacterized membrane protein YhaH (DUF805 family)
MLIPLFLCIGFMIAVLYIDLVFDTTALPYRRTKSVLPRDVLESITNYYGRITRNPYLLMFIMTTAATCIISEIVFDLVPPRIGYSSLALFGVMMLISTLKVIPAARRLASGKESTERQIRLVHSLFPYHVLLLIAIIALTLLQFSTVRE